MQDNEVNSIIANPDRKKGRNGLIIGIIAVIVLIAGVGVGIFLVGQNQEIRNQAATAGTCSYTVLNNACLSTEVWCQKDLRCYPADKAAQVNCTDALTPEQIDKNIDDVCKNGDNVTICGKTQKWSEFDKELRGANYPGQYNHARVEARAYIGASCPETLAQAAAQSSTSPSPTASPTIAPSTSATSSPTPNPTTTSSGNQTTAPTNSPTPTPVKTGSPSPTATNRVSVVTSEQGIPNTGTGTPALIGVGLGILLLIGAVVLAL